LRTRVKICGITSAQDAAIAVRHGADAIGLVFYEQSPRSVSIDQARDIVAQLPAFVSVVALFVDAESAWIESVIEQVNIDLIQFHGQETAEDCSRYGKRFIKAISMREGIDLVTVCAQYEMAAGLLVDSYQPGIPGGTGNVFDWGRIPKDLNRPVILAGGLNKDNVEAAILAVKPYAVDVSSGVEWDKGRKDEAKIESFMRGVIKCQK